MACRSFRATANHRLVACENHRVSFRWRNYAHGGKNKVMTVPADEFLRRFLIHILPKGLVRIRHFGLFANRRRAASDRGQPQTRRDDGPALGEAGRNAGPQACAR
jgi:Putative transposase